LFCGGGKEVTIIKKNSVSSANGEMEENHTTKNVEK
jgi:hypothetical protein